MALSDKELHLITEMTKAGAHPVLLARLFFRDPRVVAQAIESARVKAPPVTIPRQSPSPALREQIREIVTRRSNRPQRVNAIKQALGLLEGRSADEINLLLKTFVEERDAAIDAELS